MLQLYLLFLNYEISKCEAYILACVFFKIMPTQYKYRKQKKAWKIKCLLIVFCSPFIKPTCILVYVFPNINDISFKIVLLANTYSSISATYDS